MGRHLVCLPPALFVLHSSDMDAKRKKSGVPPSGNVVLMRLVGSNLKRIRTQKGLTQLEMAEACGFSERMAREVELGNRAPSFISLWRMCEGLGVQAFEFFLPEEGGEKYSKRKLLGQLKEDVMKDVAKRFDQHIE